MKHLLMTPKFLGLALTGLAMMLSFQNCGEPYYKIAQNAALNDKEGAPIAGDPTQGQNIPNIDPHRNPPTDPTEPGQGPTSPTAPTPTQGSTPPESSGTSGTETGGTQSPAPTNSPQTTPPAPTATPKSPSTPAGEIGSSPTPTKAPASRPSAPTPTATPKAESSGSSETTHTHTNGSSGGGHCDHSTGGTHGGDNRPTDDKDEDGDRSDDDLGFCLAKVNQRASRVIGYGEVSGCTFERENTGHETPNCDPKSQGTFLVPQEKGMFALMSQKSCEILINDYMQLTSGILLARPVGTTKNVAKKPYVQWMKGGGKPTEKKKAFTQYQIEEEIRKLKDYWSKH